MSNTAKKCLIYFSFALSIIALLGSLFIALDPSKQMNTQMRLISSVITILPIFFATYLLNSFPINQATKKRNTYYLWLFLFIYYTVQLIYMLFFAKEYNRALLSPTEGSYFESLLTRFNQNTNLVPFKTISSMLSLLPSSLNQYVILNLVGNFLAFMPFAFFIFLLFNRFRKFFPFIILLSSTILCVELFQYLSFTGAMDIDDFILNFIGALIVFDIMKQPALANFINRLLHNTSE